MQANGLSYQVIFIDDGSTDNSWAVIESLAHTPYTDKSHSVLKKLWQSLRRCMQALPWPPQMVVLTMDADLQDSPEEIPQLYDMILNQGFDLVSGWKKVRYDSKIFKNFPSKIFNWAARKTSGVQLNDFNCGLKAYNKRRQLKTLRLPVKCIGTFRCWQVTQGFTNIGEKIVLHQPRKVR